jgi:mRNA-degrading endonuclease YafQ of YafQ-DinJ toxin-antitoxin module
MKSDRIVVAECYGHKLYAEDLEGVVPADVGRMDSLSRVNAFIDSWIRTQLLIHQAEINLPPEQLDFSKQLQDYRNSLTIYAYESQLIEQYMDTIVNEQEIETYYEEHKENFQLRSTMVKVAYVILDESCKFMKDFKQLMSRRDTLMMNQLDELVEQYAVSSFLDVDEWIRLDDLLSKVPLEIFNAESFLKRNRFVSFEKDNFVYLVRFEDYLMEKSVSPLEMESDNIKSIILLKRKKELLQQMNADLYERAKNEKVFEIY